MMEIHLRSLSKPYRGRDHFSSAILSPYEFEHLKFVKDCIWSAIKFWNKKIQFPKEHIKKIVKINS